MTQFAILKRVDLLLGGNLRGISHELPDIEYFRVVRVMFQTKGKNTLKNRTNRHALKLHEKIVILKHSRWL